MTSMTSMRYMGTYFQIIKMQRIKSLKTSTCYFHLFFSRNIKEIVKYFLICKLFYDILINVFTLAFKFLDIHSIAESVAKIGNVNLPKIHLKLLERWLPSSSHNKQEDPDMVLSLFFFRYLKSDKFDSKSI